MKPTCEEDILQALRDEFGWHVPNDTGLSLATAHRSVVPLVCEVCSCAGTILIVTSWGRWTHLICPDRLSCRDRIAARRAAIETADRVRRDAVLATVHIHPNKEATT